MKHANVSQLKSLWMLEIGNILPQFKNLQYILNNRFNYEWLLSCHGHHSDDADVDFVTPSSTVERQYMWIPDKSSFKHSQPTMTTSIHAFICFERPMIWDQHLLNSFNIKMRMHTTNERTDTLLIVLTGSLNENGKMKIWPKAKKT